MTVVFFYQRSLIFFPSHLDVATRLTPWTDADRTIGYCREVDDARTIWLMTHGNAGQAADRDYALSRMSDQDSFYVVEYPGYGARDGKPCLESFNQATAEAYRILRSRYPNTPICVLGESIGSGPACSLARQETPPDKIVLVVPFDSLLSVASKRFYFLPVRPLLLDNWDNAAALRNYAGPVDIFGAIGDKIIPIEHAKTLADQIPSARLIRFSGGHNDWSYSRDVEIKQ
ncbi:alpha/beta hydrolase [Rubripirellula reticaptiva]|uniref:Alpha/beta hydrolase family protein n=1 Tax=Rubripirellula reticaptiva TaxID=2528013 RepID=A0A5C6FDI2_9BACT|nr:alpha/beta hydrolase [Rubripirellula reticaptiva]TWU57729.1 Alpha/beta hydrolase family protein [Rubripirellula reticaptiva]